MQSRKNIRIALPEIGQNVHNYVQALLGVGAEPVIISVMQEHSHNSSQQEYLDYHDFNPANYNGLLLPGGVDIEPFRYREENRGSVGMDPVLDALQISILDQCVKARIPVFGICRGHQLINVYFGGTLNQDIPTAEAHARYRLEDPDKMHYGDAEEGSILASLYGKHFPHNSAHHQAVDQLGKGLICDEVSSGDQIIEAMHHESLPIYSVQWHPERMCFENAREDTVDGSIILEWFVEKCRNVRQKDFDETEMVML